MKLKKIRVYGFKSFMGKSEISFDDGITAIVGPNGCGKSNVADAIRWVLGEQSAKTLRGSVMQDVIFNGTENRKSLSYCEVSLIFDNSDKMLPLDYNEVAVTRKLYRSGESAYFINKSVCRLKDITNLMRQAQVGREGYSIIGQGRVDQFISLNPDNRRSIFDEATGIAGAKQKKLEAERKLTRTRDNLTRYLDILGELERQVGPMREQAKTARLYLDYKEKLKYHEINSFIHKTDFAKFEKEKQKNKIEGVKEALVLAEKESNQLEVKYQQSLLNISEADKKIKTLRERQLELAISMEKLESSNELSSQRISFLEEQNELLKREIDELKAIQKDDNLTLKSINIELKERQNQYDELIEEIEIISKDLEISNADLKEKDSELSEYREITEKAKENISKLEAKRQALLKSIEYTENTLEEREGENKSADAKMNTMFDQILKKQSEIERLSSKVENSKNEIVELDKKLGKISGNLFTITGKLDEIEKSKVSIISQKNFYEKMKSSHEGFATPVRKLLNDAQDDEKLSNSIEGVVADLISTEKEYEIAIEATLGRAIQNVVTPDVEDAKYLISYLKTKHYGQVTFLPIPFVKTRELRQENLGALQMKGVLGVASDLVTFDYKYERVIASLMGATVIVDNIDNAIKVADKYNKSFKIVTLQGDILSTSGAISGGSRHSQIANVLSYDREIKTAEENIHSLNLTLNELSKLKNDTKKKQEELNNEKEFILSDIQSFEINIAKTKEILNSLKSNSDLTKSESNIKIERILEDRNKLESFKKDFAQTEREIELKSNELKKASEMLSSNSGEYDDVIVKANSIQEKLNEKRIEKVKLQSKIDSINKNIENLNYDIEESEKQIGLKFETIENNTFIIKKSKENFKKATPEDAKELKEIEIELSNFDEYKEKLNKNIKEVGDKRTLALTSLQKLISKKSNLEISLEQMDIDLKNLREKLQDEYDLSYEDALGFKDEEYKFKGANSEIKKLKKLILGLGNVNVNAIEELGGLNERFEEMSRQRDDMLKAEEDLKTIIEKLNVDMREKFNEGFKKVNEYFAQTFKELFEGGNATLKLLEKDSKDVLDYGVDIEAEPPGKALQNISLLSGGEKSLTAIAIIISIMKLRPMPFCIFDEIESALDEVNTVRFANYINKFSGNTQFIIITHKKSTMEIANRIFGVTMQEKGISKLISVNLSQIESEGLVNGEEVNI